VGSKPNHLGPVLNFACSGPTLVVFRVRKVVKIWPKKFSAILTRIDKNCNPNSVIMFRVQNGVIRTRFTTLPAPGLHWWFSGPKKSSKFDRNIFQPHWRETIRTAPQLVRVCFGCKTKYSEPDFQLCQLDAYSGGVQARKIWPKHFSIVLLGNDRNCTLNNVSIFRVPNWVVRARLWTLAAPGLLCWCSSPEMSSNSTNTFFSCTNRKQKNYTPKTVGMFWVQNQVIRVRFSTLPSPVVFGPEKVGKIWPKQFLAYWQKIIKILSKQYRFFSGAKPSHPGPVFNFNCSGGVWARKSRQNSTETFFSRTDGKW